MLIGTAAVRIVVGSFLIRTIVKIERGWGGAGDRGEIMKERENKRDNVTGVKSFGV